MTDAADPADREVSSGRDGVSGSGDPDAFWWRGRIARLRNGLHIEVDSRDMVSREILRQECWEWETYHFLEHWLREGMTVIDAGAHVGQYSLLASAGVGPDGSVHAFEPHPGVYEVPRRRPGPATRGRAAPAMTRIAPGCRHGIGWCS